MRIPQVETPESDQCDTDWPSLKPQESKLPKEDREYRTRRDGHEAEDGSRRQRVIAHGLTPFESAETRR
jgi:hypothetical protein